MTDHQITPPPELVEQWRNQAPEGRGSQPREMWIATRAAQWGSDQELEACVKWLNSYMPGKTGDQLLRPFRRPKPPSLKEQALEAARIELDPNGKNGSLILRALEALPDD